MQNTTLAVYRRNPSSRPMGPRDVIAVGFRWRTRMVLVFCLVMAGALLAAVSFREYQSEMKILARRERATPLATVDSAPQMAPGDLSEQDLNAEVELLRDADVLRSVVLATGLNQKTSLPLWYRLLNHQQKGSAQDQEKNAEEVRIAKAVRTLSSRLEISLPKESGIITVRYSSPDPTMSMSVLRELSKSYVDKHMEIRRTAGQYDFFAQQAEHYRQNLADAEAQLAKFSRQGGPIAGEAELQIAVEDIGHLREQLQTTLTTIGETRERIRTLQEQMASTEPRMTTAVRTSDNANLIMELQSTLLKLQLQRTDLLKKFQSDYPLVQAVDEQIQQTQEAMKTAESSPVRDETTDRNPTYEWMRSELAKASADLNSLESRASSLRDSLTQGQQTARTLNEKTIEQADLLRTVKTMEENYQLYLKKSEQARIENALDQDRFLNVSIAQAPTLPVLPKSSPMFTLLLGLLAASVLSVAVGLISEYLDNSFRSPNEVEWELNVPVLAAFAAGETRTLISARLDLTKYEQNF